MHDRDRKDPEGLQQQEGWWLAYPTGRHASRPSGPTASGPAPGPHPTPSPSPSSIALPEPHSDPERTPTSAAAEPSAPAVVATSEPHLTPWPPPVVREPAAEPWRWQTGRSNTTGETVEPPRRPPPLPSSSAAPSGPKILSETPRAADSLERDAEASWHVGSSSQPAQAATGRSHEAKQPADRTAWDDAFADRTPVDGIMEDRTPVDGTLGATPKEGPAKASPSHLRGASSPLRRPQTSLPTDFFPLLVPRPPLLPAPKAPRMPPRMPMMPRSQPTPLQWAIRMGSVALGVGALAWLAGWISPTSQVERMSAQTEATPQDRVKGYVRAEQESSPAASAGAAAPTPLIAEASASPANPPPSTAAHPTAPTAPSIEELPSQGNSQSTAKVLKGSFGDTSAQPGADGATHVVRTVTTTGVPQAAHELPKHAQETLDQYHEALGHTRTKTESSTKGQAPTPVAKVTTTTTTKTVANNAGPTKPSAGAATPTKVAPAATASAKTQTATTPPATSAATTPAATATTSSSTKQPASASATNGGNKAPLHNVPASRLVELGKRALFEGKRREAIAMLEAASRNDPSNMSIRVYLAQARGQLGFAHLQIVSKPMGQPVRMDGLVVGITPLDLPAVPPGEYTVEAGQASAQIRVQAGTLRTVKLLSSDTDITAKTGTKTGNAPAGKQPSPVKVGSR